MQDTGVGIHRDKLDAIFKPFIQAGKHRDKEKTGSGLGLAIVNRLIQLLGGTVTVVSVMGKGSAFHIRFPNVPVSVRLPQADSDSAEAGEEADFNQLRPARILVVDDNEMNCQLVGGMFAGSHHRLDSNASSRTRGRDSAPKTRRWTAEPPFLLKLSAGPLDRGTERSQRSTANHRNPQRNGKRNQVQILLQISRLLHHEITFARGLINRHQAALPAHQKARRARARNERNVKNSAKTNLDSRCREARVVSGTI